MYSEKNKQFLNYIAFCSVNKSVMNRSKYPWHQYVLIYSVCYGLQQDTFNAFEKSAN